MKEHNPELKYAVIGLLARGLCRPHEAAELAGVSLQVMNYWIAGMNWKRNRRAELLKAWRRVNGPKLVKK